MKPPYRNRLRFVGLVALGLGAASIGVETVFAQNAMHPCWQGMVHADSVRADLLALTSPSMEGRGTGQPGYLKAAQWVANRLESWQLEHLDNGGTASGPYFHSVPYLRSMSTGGTLDWNGRKWQMGRDFMPVSRRRADSVRIAPVYRMDCNTDLEKWSASRSGRASGTGPFAVIYEGRLRGRGDDSQTECWFEFLKKVRALGCVQVFYKPTRFSAFKRDWQSEEAHRVRVRLREGQAVQSSPMGKTPVQPSQPSQPAQPPQPMMQEYAVNAALYRSIRQRSADFDAAEVNPGGDLVIRSRRDSFNAPNVVGLIRGKSRPDEYVFLTAHLDHLGVTDGTVYPGADDNGSGSAVLLSVARALSQLSRQNIQPDRSIVLIWFSGEENGLLGSRWMASTLTDSMGIGSGQVFANINMDMLGRSDEEHSPEDPYLYVVHHENNPSIRQFTEQVNSFCGGMKLDYRYSRSDDPERLFTRSDHYAFHQLGIPSFFLFSGLHADYHKPTDTADKISWPRLTRNAGFVLNLAWQMAQRNERLSPVEEEP